MLDQITVIESPATTIQSGFKVACKVCGFTFTSKSPAALYCSTKCQKKVAWHNKKIRDATTAAAKLAAASQV